MKSLATPFGNFKMYAGNTAIDFEVENGIENLLKSRPDYEKDMVERLIITPSVVDIHQDLTFKLEEMTCSLTYFDVIADEFEGGHEWAVDGTDLHLGVSSLEINQYSNYSDFPVWMVDEESEIEYPSFTWGKSNGKNLRNTKFIIAWGKFSEENIMIFDACNFRIEERKWFD